MARRVKLAPPPAARTRAESSALAEFNAAANPVEITYAARRDGGRERIPASATPVTDSQIKYLIRGSRVLERGECLEAIGRPATSRMIRAGQLRRFPGSEWLWVTVAAAARFGLPPTVRLAGGAVVPLAPAP